MGRNASLVILATDGYGKELAEAAIHAGRYQNVDLLDDLAVAINGVSNRDGEVGSPWPHEALQGMCGFVVAIRDNRERRNWFLTLASKSYALISFQSKYAVVSDTAHIGAGSIVMHHAVVNPDACIGENVIVDERAIVEHDTIVGAHSHLAPGSVLAGGVSVGEMCLLGCGSIVCPSVKIASDVVIRPGSVVTKNIDVAGSYAGAPAKRIGA